MKLHAEALIEALPYIKDFAGSIIVIKYGGAAMVEQHLKEKVMQDVALLKYVGMHPVIIHGGGKEITRWLEKVGKKAKFIDGLRVTDAETIEIAEMVLVGKVSKELVYLISKYGGHAVSLSGKDGGLVTAKKIKSKTDLGFVGDIASVNTKVIHHLIEDGYIPVISSIGVDKKGQTFNINADHFASALASSLKARKLILLTDVPGVLDKNKKLIQKIKVSEVNMLTRNKTIQGGMIPKLQSAAKALRKGVRAVHIIDGRVEHCVLLELLTNHGVGTMIYEVKNKGKKNK
ncbi:MAG: acetylglutamate kinase [Candidatus Margulisbacteria bacterium]|nr:acetylglutamate kinase [Candidatus Margulisiibacteriota bacterium]